MIVSAHLELNQHILELRLLAHELLIRAVLLEHQIDDESHRVSHYLAQAKQV